MIKGVEKMKAYEFYPTNKRCIITARVADGAVVEMELMQYDNGAGTKPIKFTISGIKELQEILAELLPVEAVLASEDNKGFNGIMNMLKKDLDKAPSGECNLGKEDEDPSPYDLMFKAYVHMVYMSNEPKYMKEEKQLLAEMAKCIKAHEAEEKNPKTSEVCPSTTMVLLTNMFNAFYVKGKVSDAQKEILNTVARFLDTDTKTSEVNVAEDTTRRLLISMFDAFGGYGDTPDKSEILTAVDKFLNGTRINSCIAVADKYSKGRRTGTERQKPAMTIDEKLFVEECKLKAVHDKVQNSTNVTMAVKPMSDFDKLNASLHKSIFHAGEASEEEMAMKLGAIRFQVAENEAYMRTMSMPGAGGLEMFDVKLSVTPEKAIKDSAKYLKDQLERGTKF